MAWVSTLPPDLVVADWWDKQSRMKEHGERAAEQAAARSVPDRPEWRVPALQARVSRLDRTIRDALAKSEERSRSHQRGVLEVLADGGEVEHGPGGRVLQVK
ncbi:MAG TPA: hypothetical protein VFB94_17280 [Acidimicrobiales bacterium]|nr:hypothetical protein [Acidimicrobiales bacterium]